MSVFVALFCFRYRTANTPVPKTFCQLKWPGLLCRNVFQNKVLQVSRPPKPTNGTLIWYDKMIVVYFIIIAAIQTNYYTNMEYFTLWYCWKWESLFEKLNFTSSFILRFDKVWSTLISNSAPLYFTFIGFWHSGIWSYLSFRFPTIRPGRYQEISGWREIIIFWPINFILMSLNWGEALT